MNKTLICALRMRAIQNTFRRNNVFTTLLRTRQTDMCTHTLCAVVFLLCVDISLNRPLDFICDPELRRSMDVTPALHTLMSECVDQLPSPVLCPCVAIHRGTWKHTPAHRQFQQKQAFVRESLGAFLRSLRVVKDRSSSCQTRVLKKLEHSVENHLLIVNALERQRSSYSGARDCTGPRALSVTETLLFYSRLVHGPVDLLMESLQHTCTHTHEDWGQD
ncbi:uncharacterized protein LOC120478228 isoform X1 [Pimephales promelas]|uniref:uncharacterized protein LOC120478228 isoform X1 n=1 Tax=Pimephales promelas TaxID=90988 RepID=UPI0019557DA2|nr:uncharacterized protein LOC120478228 isoform X1 [Pimephales promelas]